MYRQYVRRRIRGPESVGFLLQDDYFPRAVAHNLMRMQQALSPLPRSDAPLRALARVQRMLGEKDLSGVYGEALHELIDKVQLELANVHEMIRETWFLPPLDQAD